MLKKNRGIAHLALLLFIPLIVLTITTTRAGRYAYLTAQHISYNLGANLNNIATDSYVQFINSQNEQANNGQSIFLNKVINTAHTASSNISVLGETANVDDNKWIEVDLSEQKLYMKDHGNVVNSFLISSGKWSPTPQGEWRVWTKIRSARMKGGSKALGTFYDLKNVPYTMYYNQGYGVHGAYWHNNFGHPMSHGCINMKPEEAGVVFNWAQVGTRVIVHD